MSYVSVLKNIPVIISQPAGIAALASVGIHGAIALFLPLMPVESQPKQPKSPKTVGLVELNQAEQSRLPQTSTPQLPQQGQISLQGQLPLKSQVPPFPNFANKPTTSLPAEQPISALVEPALPSIPTSPERLNVVSLPNRQDVQIPPAKNWQYQPKLDTSANITPPIPRVQDKIALGEPQPLPSTQENRPHLPSNLPELQAANLPIELPGNSTSTPAQNNTTATASQTQEFVAPIGTTPQVGDKLTLAGAALPQWQQQQPASNIPQLPITSTIPQRTEQQIATINTFGDQFQKVKQQYPNIETKKPISETVNVQRGQEGNVRGGLVIDSEGKVESIDFLDNSVSSTLKTSTREFFREYFQKNPVQANGKPKYYPFSLSFLPHNSTTVGATSPKLPTLTPQKLPPLGINETQPLPKLSNGQQQDLMQRLQPPQQNHPSPQEVQQASTDPQPPTVKLSPQAAATPAPQSVQVGKNQIAPGSQATQTQIIRTQVSSQKLINKLRQLREERQNSNQVK